jgi:hypothetical protein
VLDWTVDGVSERASERRASRLGIAWPSVARRRLVWERFRSGSVHRHSDSPGSGRIVHAEFGRHRVFSDSRVAWAIEAWVVRLRTGSKSSVGTVEMRIRPALLST